MKVYFKLIIISLILFLSTNFANSAIKKKDLDLLIVLDDSGSMIKNDPGGLTKEAAKIIVDRVGENDRLGLISFSAKSELLSGLITIRNESDKVWFKSMIENLPQKGKYTNITLSLERALYELKHNGRENALRSIIFLTDGKLDIPGGESKRMESMNFLRTSIISDYKKHGISIYSIAFTEESDFSLMQFLAQSTGGEYYRAYSSVDLKNAFNTIYNILEKKQIVELKEPKVKLKKPEVKLKEFEAKKIEEFPPLRKPKIPKKKGMSGITIIFIIGVVVLIAFAVFLIFKSQKKLQQIFKKSEKHVYTKIENLKGQTVARPTSAQYTYYLEPVEETEGLNNFFLKKKITKIGRRSDNDLILHHKFISNRHAEIYWEKNQFILRDLNSTNGTYINEKKINISPIKEGDEISFDRIKFQVRSS
jgi:Mg-chelatase subunit ChlD